MDAPTPQPSFDPIRIALDLTGPNEPPFRRRNAARALRIIGTAAAAEALVNVALGEPDEDTRQAIANELIALCAPGAPTQSQPVPLPPSAVAGLFDRCRISGAEGRRARAIVLDLYEGGVLADSDLIPEVLVNVALDKGSTEQRGRAIHLLTNLPPGSVQLAAQAFRQQFDGPRWRDAYLLLGRLRRSGLPFATPRGIWGRPSGFRAHLKSWQKRWLRTWRIPWATSGTDLPVRRFRWDFLPFATAVAVAAAIVGAYDVAQQTPQSLPAGFISLIVLLGVAVSVVLTIISTSASTPVLLHYDRVFAALVGITRASAGPFVAAVLMSMLLMALTPRDWTSATLLTSSIVILVALVRGTAMSWSMLLPRGVARPSLIATWPTENHPLVRRRHPADRWMPVFTLQLFSALCVGIATQWLVRRFFVDMGTFSGELRSTADAIWIILTPAATGMAAAAALAERPFESWAPREAGFVERRLQASSRSLAPRRDNNRAFAIAGVGALALASIVFLTTASFLLREPRSQPAIEWNEAKLGQSQLVTRSVNDDGGEIRFRVAFPQTVALLADDVQEDFPLELLSDIPAGRSDDGGPTCERTESPRVVVRESFGSPRLSLGWGCYRVSLRRTQRVQNPISALARVFAMRVGASVGTSPSLPTVRVLLNEEGAARPAIFADGNETALEAGSTTMVIESQRPVDFTLDRLSVVGMTTETGGEVTLLSNEQGKFIAVPFARSRTFRTNRTVLRPGRYRLRTNLRATWATLDPHTAAPAPLPFDQSIDVPSALHVVVNESRLIDASLRDPTTDMVLRMYALSGDEIAFDDSDPERITRLVAPGDYVIFVEENRGPLSAAALATSSDSAILRIQSVARPEGNRP